MKMSTLLILVLDAITCVGTKFMRTMGRNTIFSVSSHKEVAYFTYVSGTEAEVRLPPTSDRRR